MVHIKKKNNLKEKEKCKLVRYHFLPVSLGKFRDLTTHCLLRLWGNRGSNVVNGSIE